MINTIDTIFAFFYTILINIFNNELFLILFSLFILNAIIILPFKLMERR